jgi:hypothetical protein
MSALDAKITTLPSDCVSLFTCLIITSTRPCRSVFRSSAVAPFLPMLVSDPESVNQYIYRVENPIIIQS